MIRPSLFPCTCGAAVDGKWAGIHSKNCAVFKPLTDFEFNELIIAARAAVIFMHSLITACGREPKISPTLMRLNAAIIAVEVTRAVTPAARDGGRMDMEAGCDA